MTHRLPDVGRNKGMMAFSCHLHMLCAKDEYALCHNEYASDGGNRGKIAPHQSMGYRPQAFLFAPASCYFHPMFLLDTPAYSEVRPERSRSRSVTSNIGHCLGKLLKSPKNRNNRNISFLTLRHKRPSLAIASALIPGASVLPHTLDIARTLRPQAKFPDLTVGFPCVSQHHQPSKPLVQTHRYVAYIPLPQAPNLGYLRTKQRCRY